MDDRELRHRIYWSFATTGSAPEVGAAAPLEAMWSLTVEWYGDRTSLSHERKPVAELQAMLRRAGMLSDFWKFPT